MDSITIVMYHYVRELSITRYPKIKGLLLSEFRQQLKYFKKHYSFITMKECVDALYAAVELPPHSILLTFDDGYIEHFTNVFPLLEEEGIQGCFFPSAGAILENRVFNVNKIHFLLSTVHDKEKLILDIYKQLNRFREKYSLESNEYYYQKYAEKSRYDTKNIVFIKKLLQIALDKHLSSLILGKLFNKYVTNDEAAFANELYMDKDQLKCMQRNGMYIGVHGYNHENFNTLSKKEQEQDINSSLEMMKSIGSPVENWTMAYPYGAYNNSLIEIIKRKKCKVGLTTIPALASSEIENAYTMGRLDTNDFPKTNTSLQNKWVKRVLG